MRRADVTRMKVHMKAQRNPPLPPPHVHETGASLALWGVSGDGVQGVQTPGTKAGPDLRGNVRVRAQEVYL